MRLTDGNKNWLRPTLMVTSRKSQFSLVVDWQNLINEPTGLFRSVHVHTLFANKNRGKAPHDSFRSRILLFSHWFFFIVWQGKRAKLMPLIPTENICPPGACQYQRFFFFFSSPLLCFPRFNYIFKVPFCWPLRLFCFLANPMLAPYCHTSARCPALANW